MNEQPIRFVAFRYSHHSPHSGYSRLAEFGKEQWGGEIIMVDKPVSPRLIRERIMRRIAGGTPGYTRAALAAELKIIKHMLTEQGGIYHFLYGETTYHYAGLLNRFRRNRVIATFHLPLPGIQRAIHTDWHLRQLSAVICVGTTQQEFFAERLDHERVFFVPLGVDTDYFTPPLSFASRDPDLCLIVGENYRDFPTLRGVIELVAYCRPQTQFVVVGSAQSAHLLGEHPNLTLRSGIPEAEFRELYRSAALMLMPLRDTTANNAVLESMACGLPMVASDVGAIRDYVTPDAAALLPPHNARKMADTVLELLNEPQERQRMAEQARRHALNFSWPNVVAQSQAVYQAVA